MVDGQSAQQQSDTKPTHFLQNIKTSIETTSDQVESSNSLFSINTHRFDNPYARLLKPQTTRKNDYIT